MSQTALLIIGLAVALFGFFQASAETATPGNFDALYKKHGLRYGVDWRLIKAVAIVESSERGGVKNPNEPSYGVMQLYCEADCPGCRCKNVKNIDGWNEATPERLLRDADFNIRMGAQVLRWHLTAFHTTEKAVATYNCWSCRTDPPEGPFGNQGYVDKVMREYALLKTFTSADAVQRSA